MYLPVIKIMILQNYYCVKKEDTCYNHVKGKKRIHVPTLLTIQGMGRIHVLLLL